MEVDFEHKPRITKAHPALEDGVRVTGTGVGPATGDMGSPPFTMRWAFEGARSGWSSSGWSSGQSPSLGGDNNDIADSVIPDRHDPMLLRSQPGQLLCLRLISTLKKHRM